MSETSRIADQMRRAFEGEAWHGPALLEILAEVDAATAASHPIANAHSIWELVLHVTAWEGVILRRTGGEALTPSDEQNFPEISDKSPAAWKRAVATLKRKHRKLATTVSAMADAKLRKPVPGKPYDFYFMLHGAVQHVLYHAGQMAILAKARK